MRSDHFKSDHTKGITLSYHLKLFWKRKIFRKKHFLSETKNFFFFSFPPQENIFRRKVYRKAGASDEVEDEVDVDVVVVDPDVHVAVTCQCQSIANIIFITFL